MNIGHDWYRRPRHNLRQTFGGGFIVTGTAHDVATGGG
jgi:hypothetical protein